MKRNALTFLLRRTLAQKPMPPEQTAPNALHTMDVIV